MTYLNPVPIAAGCFLNAGFVQEALGTIFRAVIDLVMRGYNLELDFEDCVSVCIMDKKVKAVFSNSVLQGTKQIEACWPVKSINSSLSVIPTSMVEGAGESISRVFAIKNGKRRTSKLDSLQIPDPTRLKDMKSKMAALSEASKDLSHIASTA